MRNLWNRCVSTCSRFQLMLSYVVCNVVMCFKCSRQYHQGRCRKGTVEKGFRVWKRNKKNVKQCPRCKFLPVDFVAMIKHITGKFAIEKTRGCNHMTCVKCHYQFCWLCLKKYTISHFDGPYACPMMSDRNPVSESVVTGLPDDVTVCS